MHLGSASKRGLMTFGGLVVAVSLPLLALLGCDPDQAVDGPRAEGSSDAAADSPTADSSTTDAAPDTTADAGPDATLDGGPLFARTGGTFNGVPLAVVDATAFLTQAKSPAPGVKSRLVIVAEDRAALCAAGSFRQNGTFLTIDAQSGDLALQPGTFTQKFADGPGQVDVGISKLSASCGSSGKDYGATVATVVVTQVTATSVAGTFDLTFPSDAGTLQGSFNVPICGQPFDTTCKP